MFAYSLSSVGFLVALAYSVNGTWYSCGCNISECSSLYCRKWNKRSWRSLHARYVKHIIFAPLKSVQSCISVSHNYFPFYSQLKTTDQFPCKTLIIVLYFYTSFIQYLPLLWEEAICLCHALLLPNSVEFTGHEFAVFSCYVGCEFVNLLIIWLLQLTRY